MQTAACENIDETGKSQKLLIGILTLYKNTIFQHRYQKHVKMYTSFVFILWLVSFGVCIYINISLM